MTATMAHIQPLVKFNEFAKKRYTIRKLFNLTSGSARGPTHGHFSFFIITLSATSIHFLERALTVEIPLRVQKGHRSSSAAVGDEQRSLETAAEHLPNEQME